MSEDTTITLTKPNGLRLAQDLAKEFGFEVPEHFELQVVHSWSGDYSGRLLFNGDCKDVPDETRRRIKRACKLDVPSYQQDSNSTSKDLEGSFVRRDWNVEFTLNGALECEITGSTEEPAGEYYQTRAAELANLSPGQLAYLVQLEIQRLLKPKVKHTFTCEPV